MRRGGYVTVRALAIFAVAAALLAAGVAGVSIYRGRSLKPRREGIISLSPALTDMLFRIGAGEQVTGVSEFTHLPDGVKRPVVGDAMRINRELILWLRPRAILIQQQPTDVLKLLASDDGIPVEPFRIEMLEDLRAALRRLDAIAGTDGSGAVIADIDGRFDAVRRGVAGRNRPTVLLAIGRDPVMAAGRGTFLDELIEIAGGRNVVKLGHYTSLNDEQVAQLAPQIIIDVVEDAWAGDADKVAERQRVWAKLAVPAVRAGRVHVLPDSTVTIPGAHVGRTARKLAELIHPDIELPADPAPATRPQGRSEGE